MDQDGAFGTFRERVPALRVRNVPDTWGTQVKTLLGRAQKEGHPRVSRGNPRRMDELLMAEKGVLENMIESGALVNSLVEL